MTLVRGCVLCYFLSVNMQHFDFVGHGLEPDLPLPILHCLWLDPEYHGQVVDIVLLADQLEEFELFLAEHRIEFVHLLRCKLLELELFINGIPKTSFGSIFRVLNECQMDKLQHCLKQIDWCFLLFSFSFSFSFTFAFILFLRWISFQILLLFLIYPFIFIHMK